MLLDLLADLASSVPDSTKFSQYTIYTMATPTSPAQPRYNATIDIDGIDATPGWSEGVQTTFNFRTENFNASKIVLLDAASNNDFNKISNPMDFPILADVADEWSDVTNGWAGRDGTRPTTLFSVTKNINDRVFAAAENQ